MARFTALRFSGRSSVITSTWPARRRRTSVGEGAIRQGLCDVARRQTTRRPNAPEGSAGLRRAAAGGRRRSGASGPGDGDDRLVERLATPGAVELLAPEAEDAPVGGDEAVPRTVAGRLHADDGLIEVDASGRAV